MHKNARLTPKGREVMLGRLEAGQHQIDVAQAMGVSLTTLKKWLRRYRAEWSLDAGDWWQHLAFRCSYFSVDN